MNFSAPTFEAREFLKASRAKTRIDVRSPGEFAAGHIPGAVNLPLFDDQERATVGTVYAKRGHDVAVRKGLEIVGPKMAKLAESALGLVSASDGEDNREDQADVFVHCWRGGMRSQSMAWLFGVSGLNANVLEGGYKAFRRLAQQTINQPWRLMVLSGLTGAGKTRFLGLLRDAGEQVCDLEALANHRGSAYGGIAQGAQPTTEQFENDLFECLDRFDAERRIWVEDEGNRIGRVVVPQPFYEQLRNAPAAFLDVDMSQRVDNLMVDYQDLPVDGLLTATSNIRKRLGNKPTDEALAAIERGDLAKAVEITLAYYDRTYLKAAAKMPRAVMQNVPATGVSDLDIVRACIGVADEVAGSSSAV